VRHHRQVANKKKSKGSAEQELKAAVKKLRSQLAAAEKSAEKWKKRATERARDAKGTRAELSAVRRRLDKAAASAAKWKGRARSAPSGAAPTPGPAMEPASESAVTMPTTEPDDSWTVTRLRAEARARQVPGYSRKTKEQLLADLRG
jgi:hypothetical protein